MFGEKNTSESDSKQSQAFYSCLLFPLSLTKTRSQTKSDDGAELLPALTFTKVLFVGAQGRYVLIFEHYLPRTNKVTMGRKNPESVYSGGPSSRGKRSGRGVGPRRGGGARNGGKLTRERSLDERKPDSVIASAEDGAADGRFVHSLAEDWAADSIIQSKMISRTVRKSMYQ